LPAGRRGPLPAGGLRTSVSCLPVNAALRRTPLQLATFERPSGLGPKTGQTADLQKPARTKAKKRTCPGKPGRMVTLIKQLGKRCHRPLPKMVIAGWRTARAIINLIMPNQSQRSSFHVIGYAEARRRRSPITCRLL